MRSVKASRGGRTIATPIDSSNRSNRFHWSLLVCSHDATVTKTSSPKRSTGVAPEGMYM